MLFVAVLTGVGGLIDFNFRFVQRRGALLELLAFTAAAMPNKMMLIFPNFIFLLHSLSTFQELQYILR